MDNSPHVLTEIVGIVEALVIVLLGSNGWGQHIRLPKQAT
jgi:hypothetical protein